MVEGRNTDSLQFHCNGKNCKKQKNKKHSEHNKADEGTLSSACVIACLNLNYLLQREEV